MSKLICVIPARGGSKGIPGKNLIPLNKIPLIHYSIHTAFQSQIFDYVIVNSDSDEILESAKLANNKTLLIKRPDNLREI